VTGATDGIGRAYAEELASRGLNIVLISRSPYKLQNVAADIETKHYVKTRIIDVDFTLGNEIYERIGKELEGLEIGVLVNNVGMSYSYPEYLAQVPNVTEFSHSLINCNVVSVTRMCLLVLAQMVERKKGLILNISSASAVLPTPLMTMYSSTKAFVHKFSEDLALEYAPFGITVQCVLPGFVATNMSRIKRPTLKAPLPKDFVQGQMKTLGLELASAGYWVHKLQLGYYLKLMTVFPSVVVKVTWDNLSNTRLRALKRQQQQQAQQNGETSKDK
jgi:17beta-estradiol 17-dehydrogenase / very-long-chain 3-oxoacyl-CoA reductase